MTDIKFDVFLAHNGKDKSDVEVIAEKLRQAGIRPWLDSWDIHGGEEFARKMAEGIYSSGCCAVFLSASGPGQWVEREIELAFHRATHNKQFHLIPVLLPGLPDELDEEAIPHFLRVLSRIDFRSGIGDPAAFRGLVEAITRTQQEVQSFVAPRQSGVQSTMRTSGSFDNSADSAPLSYLIENVPILQEHIKDLTFTPVIGPGCSLIGRSQSEGWMDIANRMQDILSSLEHDRMSSKYIRGLAEASVYDVHLSERSGQRVTGLPDDPMSALQLALAKIGSQLGVIFASVMMESATPVWDSPSFKLKIARENTDLLVVSELLVGACVAAFELKANRSLNDAESGLGAAGIYERLVELAGQLTEGLTLEGLADKAVGEHNDRSYQVVVEDIMSWRPIREYRQNRGVEGVELSLHQLEWIADALWHTLRFDKAEYPRADELAFQISLLASGVRGRRIELVTAAELGRVVLSPATVGSWYRQYGSASAPPKMLEFYDAISRVLRAQFNSYQAHVSAASQYANQSLRGFQAVAFSTTFDLELENALHRMDGLAAFHVVVPVYAFMPDDIQPELQWLIGTVRGGNPVENPTWKWFPKDKMPKPSELSGPVIVRLHGSPLLELPSPIDLPAGGFAPEFERIEHALVLSEGEYLENIVWKDPLPAFFNMVLQQKGRAFFFLGHSLGEWNTRLRLYNQVNRRDTPKVNVKRIAISRSHDPYRSAVLSGIGIHRWVGDLEVISRAVETVL